MLEGTERKVEVIENGGPLTLVPGPNAQETVRPDPHQSPMEMFVCLCGHREPATEGIDVQDKERPRMPVLSTGTSVNP